MASKSKHRIARFLSLVWVCSRLVACGGHVESDPYGPCTKSSDCPQGICVAGRCQPLQTIDPDADANVSTDSVEPADAIVSPNDGADLSAEGDGLPSDNDAPPGDSSIVECSSNAECGELQKTLASCLAAYCDPASKRCKIKAVEDGTFCDDLNACTVGDRCKSGVCTGLPKCQASPCQTSSCNPQTGQCASKPLADGSLCDDGDPCTPTDRCVKGECRSSVNICPCTTDASCGIYENGDLCDGTYLCDAGYCRIDPKTRVTCEGLADGPCQTAICDPDSGGCKVVPLDDGTSCSDGNPCTVGDKCQKGVCLGARLDCSSEDRECRTGICDPATGVCRAVPIENGTVCDDGDLCTVESVCTNGLCLGTPKVCVVAGNPCKQGFCDPGTGACRSKPINEGGECDDGDPCTSNDVCLGGVCGGVTESYGAICTLSADAIGICDTAGICQETTIALWGGPKLFGLLSTAFEAVWTTRNGPLLVAALGVGPDVGSLTESRVLVPFELGTPLEDKPLAAFFGALGGRYLGFAPSVALRVDGGGLEWFELTGESGWTFGLSNEASALLATLGLPSDQQRLSIIEAVHDATTSWAIASPLSNMLVRCTRGIEPLSCEKATLSELTSISALGSTVELAAMDDLSSLWVLGTSPTGEGIFLIGDNGALTPSCSPSDVSCDLGGYLGVARLSDSSLVAIGRAPALLRLVPGETWSRFAFPTLPPVSTSEALTPAPSTEASVKVQSYLVDGGQVYLFSVQRICSDSSCADGSLRLLMTRYQAGSGFSNTAIELTKSICTAPSTRCRCTSPESCAALEGRMFVAGAVIVDERVVIAGTLPESDSETTTAFTIAIPRAPQP